MVVTIRFTLSSGVRLATIFGRFVLTPIVGIKVGLNSEAGRMVATKLAGFGLGTSSAAVLEMATPARIAAMRDTNNSMGGEDVCFILQFPGLIDCDILVKVTAIFYRIWVFFDRNLQSIGVRMATFQCHPRIFISESTDAKTLIAEYLDILLLRAGSN